MRQAIIWASAEPVNQRIHVAQGENELIIFAFDKYHTSWAITTTFQYECDIW